MVYYYDPEMRKKQEEEYRRTGVITKMGNINLDKPLPVIPLSSNLKPQQAPAKKPQSNWYDPVVNTAVKEGVKGAGEFVGGQVAGGKPTFTGTDAQGNSTFSDGAVLKPDGTMVKEGSYAQSVRQWGGSAAAALQLYNALKNGNDRERGFGVAGAANTGLMANGAYGAGTGSIIGAGIGAVGALSSDMSDKQKAVALRRTTEDALANYGTAGIWGGVQALDRALLGGQTDKLRTKLEKAPVIGWGAQIGDKVTAKALGTFGSKKSGDQLQRDQVRKALQEGGFFGEGKDDWTLDNPDGTGFDVGKDGGARLDDGRRYYELDMASENPVQGQAIGAVNPLAYLITGGDEKLATSFAGYFTNTIMQGAGGQDLAVANANALDKYKKAGFDTPDKAHAGIDELVKAGKLDAEKAAAFHNGINTVFGIAPKANGTSGTGTRQPSTTAKKPGGKKRRGSSRRTYAEQTYTPTEYAIPTTAPMGTPSTYGDTFAQGLADVYKSNQELGL